MPRLIDAGDAAAFGLDDLVAALDAHPFDARDEDSLVDAGPLLARLGRNPTFLADLAVEELRTRCSGQTASNGYGAQVFLLRPPNGRYVVRANFWPAVADDALRASGPAAFFYDHVHDHNFPFLTYGYLGPGYWSDYYERDADGVAGVAGERAGLTYTGRRRLDRGRLMLYRARTDVHRQLPPDAFSVSLNILAQDPAQRWTCQYRFDVDSDTIVEGLTVAPAEALLAVAVHVGNGIDVAHDLACRHPFARMRTTALDAVLSATPREGYRLATLLADDADARVAVHARRILTGPDPSGTEAVPHRGDAVPAMSASWGRAYGSTAR